MSGLTRKNFDKPDEVRPFDGATGQLEVINSGEGAVGRATFLPGWRWSEHVKPIAKTDSCQAAHTGYFVSGRLKVVMDDGEVDGVRARRLRRDGAGTRRLGHRG